MTPSRGDPPVFPARPPLLDQQGWITVFAALLLALIALLTAYDHGDLRRPVVDVKVQQSALAQREQQLTSESVQIMNESDQLRSDQERLRSETEQIRNENARLAVLESTLDAVLRSADSFSPPPPAIDGN